MSAKKIGKVQSKRSKKTAYQKRIPVSFMRIFLYLSAIFGFGLVVLNWWWAFYHDGYVVISFNAFGEMGFEFFLIHGLFIIIIIFTIIAIKREI